MNKLIFLFFILFQVASAQTYKVNASLVFSDGEPVFSAVVASGDADSDLSDGEPVATSKVTLVGPEGKVEVTAMQPGMHMLIPGLGPAMTFIAGETYTLELDPEGDGTANASTDFMIPGVPVLSLQDSAILPGVFELTWQDPVAGAEGYDPTYMVSVDDGEGGWGVSCTFITKDMNFVVSSDHCADYNSGALESLPAKDYTVSVAIYTAFQDEAMTQAPRNISGDNIAGMLTIFQSSEVEVTVKE